MGDRAPSPALSAQRGGIRSPAGEECVLFWLTRRGSEDGDGRPLAWHLGLLCTALLLPLLALGAFLLLQLASTERLRHEAAAREAARRVAVALDRGLTALETMAEVLSTSDHLRAGDLAAFRERLLQLPGRAGANIVLRDTAGRILIATGEAKPGERDTAAETRALATGRAQVTGLLMTESVADAVFSVLVPVHSGGPDGPRLLAMRVPVSEIGQMLREEGVPEGMAAAVTDRNGIILARSRDPDRLVGTRPAGARPAEEPEGWRRDRDADGVPIVLAYSRVQVAGWTAWVFMPEDAFEAPLWRSIAQAVAICLLFAGLAAGLALRFARRLASPISDLAQAATDGRASAAPLTPVREINSLSRALTAAQAYAAARARAQDELLATLDLTQILIRDPAGRVVAWTSGMERLTGWSRAEALGRSAHELLRTVFPLPREEIQAALQSNGEWHGELCHKTRDGRPLRVASLWALRRTADGQVLAIVEAHTDVTALREAEGRLRDAQAELRHVARLNEMGALAAALAHEINQPLTAAASFTEAAIRLLSSAREEDIGSSAAKDAMEEAAQQTLHAGHIVRRLRDFLATSEGQRGLADVNTLVVNALELAVTGTRQRGLQVSHDLAPCPPCAVLDPVMIQQVVVNLVRNAVEAMDGKERQQLRLSTAVKPDGSIEVAVTDTGKGVELDMVDRLFAPFNTTKPSGMGVGLSISRAIVEEHGGQLGWTPNPDGGSVFHFTLPATRDGRTGKESVSHAS